jgi:hypothetical protein
MSEFLDQTGLAQRLALSTRQIRNLEADGVILRRPGDDLYDVRACQRRYEIFRARDRDAVAGEIERASAALTDAMNALLSIENIEQRREMMKAAGPRVGVLDGWLRLACALSPAGPQREFEKRYVTMTISRAVGDLLSACNMRIADDDDSDSAMAEADRHGPIELDADPF